MGRKRGISPLPDQAPPQDDRRFVSALARGLSLLRCFNPKDHWLAHQELARRTGLPQATVSRLAFTLTHLGYLRHRPASGEYALGAGVLSLGFSMLSNFEIGRIARPHMEALAEHTQAAISLGTRHGSSMVYVAHCRSTARLLLGLDVGTRLPLAETAMGRAMWCLATPGTRSRVARLIEQEDPAAWPRREAGLHRALDEHAQHGYVSCESEWESDISAIGVGLDLGDGREPLALTVGGPSTRLQGSLLHQDFATALVRTGQSIVDALQAGNWSD